VHAAHWSVRVTEPDLDANACEVLCPLALPLAVTSVDDGYLCPKARESTCAGKARHTDAGNRHVHIRPWRVTQVLIR
jgi:hypothetical protein